MSKNFKRIADNYVERVTGIGGDVGEALTSNTINFIEQSFHASPTYRVMEILSSEIPDVTEMDGRVVEIERLGSLREIILRPNKNLEIGMYAKIDDEWFMLIDKHGGTGSTSVKMTAIKTNDFLRWRDEKQYLEWLENKDKEGYIDNNYHELRCVASATDLGSKSKQSKNEIEWNKHDVRLPIGQLFISVEKNRHTEKIDLNNRFIFGRNVYEVIGIDDITLVNDEGYGIIQFTVKITPKRTEDDFDNKRIAENTYNVDIKNNEESDGRIW